MKKILARTIIILFILSFILTLIYITVTTGWGVVILLITAATIGWLLSFAITHFDD